MGNNFYEDYKKIVGDPHEPYTAPEDQGMPFKKFSLLRYIRTTTSDRTEKYLDIPDDRTVPLKRESTYEDGYLYDRDGYYRGR